MSGAKLAWIRFVVAAGLVAGGIARPVSALPECPRLQSLVDAAPAGSTVSVPPCIYRETVTIAKPLTLAGQPGAEIRGSDVWSNWAPQGDSWVSQQGIPALPVVAVDPDACEPNSDNRCLWPEQVYFDGIALDPVGRTGVAGRGQFAIDPTGHIVLGDNPDGHTIEVSTRARWIITGADGVTIQGLTMRHAGNGANAGGVSNDGHSNWTLQDNILSDAHAADVSLEGGSNVRVLRNDIGHAGLVGIMGSNMSEGGLLQGNRIHENRSAKALFNRDWGAGGLKLTQVTNFIVDGNEANHNDGIGLWCDIGCRNVTFSGNRVHHNQWQGINFEISDGARIYDNALWENGWGKTAWGWGAGIVISSSANAEVFNNTAAWNYAGISVLYQNRPSSPGPEPARNNVHDNTIIKKTVTGDYSQTYWYNLSLAWLSDGSKPMFDASWNNVGMNNRVWYDAPEQMSVRFSWSTQFMTLADFVGTVGGEGTQYLSSDAKDQLLQDLNIPLTPEN